MEVGSPPTRSQGTPPPEQTPQKPSPGNDARKPAPLTPRMRGLVSDMTTGEAITALLQKGKALSVTSFTAAFADADAFLEATSTSTVREGNPADRTPPRRGGTRQSRPI